MKHRPALAAVGAALAVQIACGPSQPSSNPGSEMSNHAPNNSLELHNSDLQWDGTPLGLQPRIANPDTARLVAAPSTIDRELVELLRDPDRFAVAHVLLTMRRKALTSFDANQWNGLRVALAASGAARYEPGDMTPLYQRWSSVVRTGKP